ncbi:MAG: hypothetical protein AAF500_14840 [Myxococcota bacterium]
MKRTNVLLCLLVLGCGDAGGFDVADGGEPKAIPEPVTGIYEFDCDTIVGGIQDLPISILVAPTDELVEGVPTTVTLSGSITLDETTVAGIADRGVDFVDINDSGIMVRVTGGGLGDVDLPGPVIPNFDFLADTDGNGLSGPHTFEVGPVDVDVIPNADTVAFGIDIDSLRLSLGGVPIIGSLNIPDFCTSRRLDGAPIAFPVDAPGGTGGAGGSAGVGGEPGTGGVGGDPGTGGTPGTGGVGGTGGAEPPADDCDRDRIFDNGRFFNGRFRQRLCEFLRSRR